MRIAAFYDIHGNLPALEAAVGEARTDGVQMLVIGGDVLPGPMPSETLDYLRALDLPALYLQGNGEREVLAVRAGSEPSVPRRYRAAMRWVAERLTDTQARWIASWPATIQLHLPGVGETLFCHATPRSDDELFTSLNSDAHLRPIFGELSANLVVCGHTHIQFERDFAGLSIVNAGSVGMAVGPEGAEWLQFEPTPKFRRTAYDRPAAAARIRSTDYPMAEEFAASSVLDPPSVEEMLAAYTRAAES